MSVSAAGVECVLDAQAQVGEGATWCAQSQRLLWVDVWQRRLHRFDPASGQDQLWDLPQRVGCVAPVNADLVLLGLESGFFSFVRSTQALQPYCLLAHAGDNRCNDSVVDPDGRLWCGTMPMSGVKGAATGELYSFDASRLVGADAPAHHDGMASAAMPVASRRPPSVTMPAAPRTCMRVARMLPAEATEASPRQSMTSTAHAAISSTATRCGWRGSRNASIGSRSSRDGM